jgi:ribonuclease BN (tRNA processing enzyme)
MSLELTFLGTGNAFAPTRYWSSFLVNDRYLFDAPPTLLAHLKRLGKDPGDIEVVFISHFHADHFFGLPFLFLEYAELAPRTKDLTIVGPPGITKRVESLTDMAFSNVFRKRDRGYALHFIEAGDGKSGEAAGCTFTSRRVTHVPDLESFAYRVACEHGSLAYSGDTVMCDALVPLADGSDVFVCECSCWGEQCGPHLNPKNVLDLRARISPSTKMVLTHLGAGTAPAAITDAGILIADDLTTIRL